MPKDPYNTFNERFSDYLGELKITSDSHDSNNKDEIAIDAVLLQIKENLEPKKGRRKTTYFALLVIVFSLFIEKCLKSIGIFATDSNRNQDAFFQLFPKKRDGNTLTIAEGEMRGLGIRKIYNELELYFEIIERECTTSQAPYATGQWKRFKDTFGLITTLSSHGRSKLISKGIERLLQELPPCEATKESPKEAVRFHNFELLLNEYPRSNPPEENGGLTLQAMTYAYLAEKYRDLSVRSSSVRVGSSRQRRIGDIDIYDGHKLKISCEVKDMHIDSKNIDSQLRAWARKAEKYSCRALVCCASVDEEIANIKNKIEWITPKSIAEEIKDLETNIKQRYSSRFLYYLHVIEMNQIAVERALKFIMRKA